MTPGLVLATVQLVAGGLILVLGLVLLRENPRHQVNRVVAFMLFLAGLGASLGSSDSLILQLNPKLSQRGVELFSEFSFLWEFFFPLLLLFSLVFPLERTLVARRPAVKFLIFLPYIGHMLLVGARAVLGEGFGLSESSDAFSSLLRLAANAVYGLHRATFALVNLTYLGISIWLIHQSERATSRKQLQRQLRVIARGLWLAGGLYVASLTSELLQGGSMRGELLLLLGLMAASGAIAYAMVRYRFLEASLLVRRAILYSLSTAVVVGMYFALVQGVGRWISNATDFDSPIYQAAILVVSLILYQPILAKMEEILERVLLRESTDYRNALRGLSERIVAHLDPDRLGAEVVGMLHESLLTDKIALVRYLDADRPTVVASAGLDDDAAPHLPSHDEAARAQTLDAHVARDETFYMLPLRLQGDTLGAIVLGRKMTGRPYSGEDETLLTATANQVSVALKNAELHQTTLRQVELERDLETARRIQRAFLPTRFPLRQEVDIFGRNVPSREVGGDYYDVLEQDRHSILLAVADVSGKGVPAALMASMLQASLRTLSSTERRVGKIMQHLNEMVCESSSVDQFATFFLARLDLTRMRLTYANAGHNFPIVTHRDGGASFLDHSDLILGVATGLEYDERAIDLSPGDRLLLFTDGISEAQIRGPNGGFEELGDDGLLELMRNVATPASAHGFVNSIHERVVSLATSEDESDDMTLVALLVGESGTAATPGLGSGRGESPI